MRKIHDKDLFQKFYRVIFDKANSTKNRQRFAYIVDRAGKRSRAGKR